MEESKYEKLLEQSIQVQVSIKDTLEILVKNTASLNDKFVLHCVNADEIAKETKLIRAELLKYIKWLLAVVLFVLASLAGIEGLTKFLGKI